MITIITRGFLSGVIGEVLYEVHVNGSKLAEVSSVVSEEEGVSFEAVWLLAVHWNNVPSHTNASQVTNDIHSKWWDITSEVLPCVVTSSTFHDSLCT